MIKVDQTIFGQAEGNCFPACLASLLHYDLEYLPNHHDKDWFIKYQEWLMQNAGVYMLCLEGYTPREHVPGYAIFSGPSPRNSGLHAVVGYAGEIVHDPHPSRAGLGGDVRDTIILIPMDPSDVKTYLGESAYEIH